MHNKLLRCSRSACHRITHVRVPVYSPQAEVNPLSRRPLALGHSGAEVASFTIKAR